MKNPVYIYGLFQGERCVYVGKTTCCYSRSHAHKRRFASLEAKPFFKVLYQTTKAKASAKEREVIEYYRGLGQAECNKWPPRVAPERKRPIYVSAETHAKLRLLAALESKSLQVLVEELISIGLEPRIQAFAEIELLAREARNGVAVVWGD